MAYDYSKLLMNIKEWAAQATTKGWIEQKQALLLIEKPENSASELFLEQNERPLIVAFMGGTGVGKSSLLNKLAGQGIAKVGVERPTSREVTLYHHQNISLQQLEQTFPLQNIKVSQHTDESNKQLIWVDMPDFDSTEEKNKAIVMQWLPYIDVLIYVVSPERYRDNKAWQLLQAEGENHAWLFVMNQWDRGDDSQYDDFKKQLAKAGFEQAIIYKTICQEGVNSEADELESLQASISSLATSNTVEQLENRSLQQNIKATKHKIQQCLHILGDSDDFSTLNDTQESRWLNTQAQLIQGFEWPIKQLAVIFSRQGVVAGQDKIKLWDDWAQSRFNDYLDELVLTADQQELPIKPLRNILHDCRGLAEKHIQVQAELSCRKALINPGNIIQRATLRLAKIAEVFLPLITIGLVAYEVFQGYYDSAVTDQAFLGVNFAVHSSLLILISWLLPFFIRKKLQPSLEKAAFKGLKKGVEQALEMIDIDVKAAIAKYKESHQQQKESLTQLAQECELEGEIQKSGIVNKQLERMLLKDTSES